MPAIFDIMICLFVNAMTTVLAAAKSLRGLIEEQSISRL